MKKVISLFLSLAMLLSIVSVVDFSAFASVKTGKCGDNVTYSLDTETGVLTISGTGKMTDYSRNLTPFYNDTKIKVITIDYGVTRIGNYAFYNCKSLTDVTIPDSVTSIGEEAFSWCESLTSVTIPDSVTSIGSFAFSVCKSLTNVTIPDSVTSIGNYTFSGCISLTSIEVSDNNGNYSSVDGVLFNKDKSELITYPASKTDNTYEIPNSVTSIGNDAFGKCRSLTSVTIPDSVTSIGFSAFGYCTNLISVTIPNSVTSIGSSAFGYCTKLTSVTIGNSVTSIGNDAFENCTNLTSVTIPDSVTSIGDHAFCECTSLTSVIIPDSVTSIGDHAFYRCESLTSVTIPDRVTSIGDEAFYRCESLTSVTIPDRVTSIGDYAFYECTSLKSVTIPGSVTSIGDYAFQGCYFTSENFVNNSNVEIDGYSRPTIVDTDDKGFCIKSNMLVKMRPVYAIGEVTIPNSITSIGSAFSDCTSLTSVTIPNSVISIAPGAFNDCTSLTSIEVSDNNGNYSSVDGVLFNKEKSELITYPTGKADSEYAIPNSVTSIGNYAFENCTNLTSVTIPDSVTSIGYSAFGYCTNIISVTIPNSVTSIGECAFLGCTSLTSVTIPDSVTSIGRGAFLNCTSLTSVTIPDSVTSIGDSAFCGCTSLTSVSIPDSVTSIGDSAFYGCSNLKSVNYSGTKSQWKAITIGSYNYYLTCAFIKCTDGIIGNENTVTVDSVKYRLNDDYTAQVISYSGTPGNITILESVTYEGFTFKVTSIGSSAFKNCTSLTSVTIPNSVESIGDNAFNGCSKLKKIEVPDSVTYIGSKAFDGTAFYNTVKNWEDGVLYCGNHLISAKSDVTKITVKASTVSIAAGALDNCKSLEKINVLNPKCVINCTIPKTTVIGGTEGSTAEDFAQKNNMSIDYFEECTHSDKVQVVIAATCTEQGAVQSRCADCDKLISQTFTAPLGHTMVITTPAKAPTCTTSGNTQAGYCTVCGYNEVSTVIPAIGHNFGNNSPNCLVCGVANPNYVAPTQPNQNDTNTSNDEDVTVISKPKSASIKKVKGAKKAVSVEWKKVSGVSGYEIQLATDKKFKKNKKTVTIKKQKTTKTTVKKLKAKKKYYVRVRTYKIVNGKKVYSSWSKVKSVKTK